MLASVPMDKAFAVCLCRPTLSLLANALSISRSHSALSSLARADVTF